jgi:hypothetical protein
VDDVKCAVVNIPFGGGRRRTCDAKALSRTETGAAHPPLCEWDSPIIGPQQDIPAPDVCAQHDQRLSGAGCRNWQAAASRRSLGRNEGPAAACSIPSRVPVTTFAFR